MDARKIGFTVVGIWETKATIWDIRMKVQAFCTPTSPWQTMFLGNNQNNKNSKRVRPERNLFAFIIRSRQQIKDTNQSLDECVISLHVL